MKFMTEAQAEAKRQKAVEFLERIGDDEGAQEFADMTARDYAEHKGVELLENPRRRKATMSRGKSKAELEAELDEAADYIEQLEDQLDQIAGIATGEGEEEPEEEDEEGEV